MEVELTALGYSIRQATRAAGVSRSTFTYRTRVRPPTDRAIRRLLLTDAIATVHAQSRGVYGYRRVQAELRMESDVVVNHKWWPRSWRSWVFTGFPDAGRGDGIW